MSVWCEGNKIDNLLSQLQQDVSDDFIERKIARKKTRRMMQEVVENHYKKKGSK